MKFPIEPLSHDRTGRVSVGDKVRHCTVGLVEAVRVSSDYVVMVARNGRYCLTSTERFAAQEPA